MCKLLHKFLIGFHMSFPNIVSVSYPSPKHALSHSLITLLLIMILEIYPDFPEWEARDGLSGNSPCGQA